MNRRTFLLGAGGVATGSSVVIGSGAFSGVVTKRDAKIAVAHDRDAYLGLHRGEGPNRSFVDYDKRGHLRLRMTRKNPTDGGGRGVNSDSHSWFDDVFRICNQGKAPAKIFILKRGPHPDRVTFYHGGLETGYEVIDGQQLAVSECLAVGIRAHTKSIASRTQLLREIVIVAVSKDAIPKKLSVEDLVAAVELDDRSEWVRNEV